MMGQHLAAVIHQKDHHLIFQGSQMYFLVMDIQFTLFKIQPEIVQTELLLLVVHRGALMAQPHADSGQQLLGAEGLVT